MMIAIATVCESEIGQGEGRKVFDTQEEEALPSIGPFAVSMLFAIRQSYSCSSLVSVK